MMTKARKIELLYKKAKGQGWDASAEEERELRRYKVDANEGSFVSTKSNIASYVTEVDKGCRLTFYDWCMENKKADRRRKNSDQESMARSNGIQNKAVVFVGWLIWGMAIYWILQGQMSAGGCAVIGAVISLVLYRIGRKLAGFTLILLPLALAAYFGSR